MAKQVKEKKVTPFFNENVSVFFQFYEKKFGLRPSFDGSAPRDLRAILEAMAARSRENGAEWTLDLSKRMFGAFLAFSYEEPWLRDNFMLFNLNRQKDKIFLKIKEAINGQSTTNQEKPIRGNSKTAGQDIFAERLRDKLEGL